MPARYRRRMKIDERTRELIEYYDEAATSFEGTYRYSADQDPASERRYNWERTLLASRVGEFGFGDLCDVGAGTGYWLPAYLDNAESITLIEPSAGMLDQLKKKVITFGIAERALLINSDHTALANLGFDSVLLSNVLGHHSSGDQVRILKAVCSATRPGGEVLIIDSMYSDRARSLHPQRTGYATRTLNTREKKLYKHYFIKPEIDDIIARSGLSLTQLYVGTHFWFAACIPPSSCKPA